ncbi:hypothetical protein OUZ56_008831 [Daphnia magna]|uniref:Uncharacterized protein n=1 Tax=Daphnia magna TaxID=35525 RepID=A0ABR0AE76_9CRUS|nr:hypothetical protein OUZ56_008831 [Daphnia magna]
MGIFQVSTPNGFLKGSSFAHNGNPQINYLLPPLAAAIEDAFVRLAGDGDISLGVE